MTSLQETVTTTPAEPAASTLPPHVALCGHASFVGECKAADVADSGSGYITFTVYSEGNTNDEMFKVYCRAETGERKAPGNVVLEMAKHAVATGNPVIRLRTNGAVEADVEANKVGGDKTLSVRQNVATVSPAHPNPAIEACQNSVFMMGRLVQEKYGVSLQFGHQSSAIDQAMSPAALMLTGPSAEKVRPLIGDDVLINGSLVRLTNLKAEGDYPAYDQLKLNVIDASKVSLTAGKPRYKVNKDVQASVTGYEDGWGSEQTADPEVMKAMLAKMDF